MLLARRQKSPSASQTPVCPIYLWQTQSESASSAAFADTNKEIDAALNLLAAFHRQIEKKRNNKHDIYNGLQVQHMQDDASEAVVQITTALGTDKNDLQQHSRLMDPLETRILNNVQVSNTTSHI